MPAHLLNFFIFSGALILSWVVGAVVPPTWTVSQAVLDVHTASDGRLYYIARNEPVYFEPVPIEDAELNPERVDGSNVAPAVTEEFAVATVTRDGQDTHVYYRLTAQYHWGYWSLLPAVVAVLLCWVTREPVPALLGGIVSGALILGQYDLTGRVLIPALATTNAAGILLLYLWLLGGLMGIWSRTGAAQAFAEFMTVRFVRGPKTAKLVAWMLGVIFFQGGTMSTVLVGTTVKPIADKENISHEELAYIVDSTASPIASSSRSMPGQAMCRRSFLSPGSVFWQPRRTASAFLSERSVCFYAIFAVLGTFLLGIEKPLFLGKRLAAAMNRSRTTGQLDADGAEPLSAKELQASNVPAGYTPHVLEFFLPLGALIGIAIGTFVVTDSPNVHWAFGAALLLAVGMALAKGMALKELMAGFHDGIRGVVLGSVILLLAITIGGVNTQTGGAVFLVDQLGESIPYFLLPVLLQLLTMIIAFSTGTSWGTYAVAFPLAMPLAWAIAGAHGLAHPELFMTLCFAAVMDGSVYGDQCSPISDTTVLSAMCTGCDLMDHVKTQIPQASVAAALAAICWTGIAFLTA